MRGYAACWRACVVTITGLAAAIAWLVESPWLLLAEVLVIGTLGFAFGLGWEEDPDRTWPSGRAWAVRGLVVAVLLTGLPPALGQWSLLVILVLGVTHPTLVRALGRRLWPWRARSPGSAGGELADLSTEQLEHRWRYTSMAMRTSWRPDETLALVEDRQRLLDEIERRDPENFSAWLSGRGGRQSQGR